MSLGDVAGLIAAIAFVLLVGLLAVPLLKLGKVLDEVRQQVHEVGEETTPILAELKTTVETTNAELDRVTVVTDEVNELSRNAAAVSTDLAALSSLATHAVSTPIIKIRAMAYGLKTGLSGNPVASPTTDNSLEGKA